LWTRVDRDSRHNRILKQELRRYGPRSISPKESPFRALFGAFYPHPAHKSSPRAEWATHTGHCSPASHPTPNQRGEVVRRPSPAGCRLPPTAEFPMNFPARSRGRGRKYSVNPYLIEHNLININQLWRRSISALWMMVRRNRKEINELRLESTG